MHKKPVANATQEKVEMSPDLKRLLGSRLGREKLLWEMTLAVTGQPPRDEKVSGLAPEALIFFARQASRRKR